MSDERSSHSKGDEHHRRHSKSHHPRERHDPELDEQSDRKKHHRHRHKHPRRSLSPGEVPPPRHRRRSLSPYEVPPPSKRHRSRHSERRPDIDKAPEKEPSPAKVQTPQEQRDVSAISPSPRDSSSDSDEIFGPMPASTSHQEQPSRRVLGRGEFGHDPKDIEKYEQMGFVMSGNRRKKKLPPAVDEASKKAGYKIQKEERQLRETELVARFKEMIENRKANDTK